MTGTPILGRTALGFVILVASICGFGPTCNGEDALPPKVLAIVIGVKNYAKNETLPGCDENAQMIAQRIRNTFKGADVRELLSDTPTPPTFGRVRSLVQIEIPKLPEFSVVIFYFAGHGVRIGDPAEVGRTDMGLVLEGGRPSSQDPDLDHLLLYSELLAALKRTRMTNFMVFLDCCHAGPEDDPAARVADLEMQILGIRGFVLAAALRSQKTNQDLFTKALDKCWDSPPNPCERPSGLEERVRSAALGMLTQLLGKPASRSWLDPHLVLGAGTQVCIGTFGNPSTFLFMVPLATTDSAYFKIGTGPEEEFQPSHDALAARAQFYVRQVPRTPMTVTCRTPSGMERDVSLRTEDLGRDVLWIDFNRPPGAEVVLPDSIALLQAATSIAYDLGARDSSAFDLELAYSQREADISHGDASTLRDRWLSRPFDDPRWRVLAGTDTNGDRYAVANSKDFLRVAALLNWSDRPAAAGSLLSERHLDSQVGKLVDLHRFISNRLAGDAASAELCAARIQSFDPGTFEVKAIRALMRISDDEALRAASLSLPVDKETHNRQHIWATPEPPPPK